MPYGLPRQRNGISIGVFLVMSRASGAHVWDVDGRRYVDLTSCGGAAPLGAGYEPVVDHVVSELRRTGGILPGPLSVHRIELAERLAEIFPRAQRSLFFRTRSCATTAAIRLARAHMGTNLVLTSGYHGWHDWQLQDRPAMGLPRTGPGQCRLPLRSRPIRETFR